MPNRCVVYGCSNTANTEKGIGLHKIPFWGDERPEAKRRRRIWTTFVSTKRAKWKPSEHSCVCSMHFKTTDFTVQFPGLKGQNSRMTPRLLQDDIGVSVYPTIHANVESTEPKGQSMTERERRIVSPT